MSLGCNFSSSSSKPIKLGHLKALLLLCSYYNCLESWWGPVWPCRHNIRFESVVHLELWMPETTYLEGSVYEEEIAMINHGIVWNQRKCWIKNYFPSHLFINLPSLSPSPHGWVSCYEFSKGATNRYLFLLSDLKVYFQEVFWSMPFMSQYTNDKMFLWLYIVPSYFIK